MFPDWIYLMGGDWTAFVPAMRPFLQLKSLDDVLLKREAVSLSEIELVTGRILKVPKYIVDLTVDGWNTTSQSFFK